MDALAQVVPTLLEYAARYRRNAAELDKVADFRMRLLLMQGADVLADPLLDALRNGASMLTRRADELERTASD